MKTIKDLREVLDKNDGTLKIGQLVFTTKEGDDIDVNLDDNLVFWVSKELPDDTLLAEIDGTVSSIIESRIKAQQKNKELKTKLEEMEKNQVDSQFALGKIEAYEKILINRSVTVSS